MPKFATTLALLALAAGPAAAQTRFADHLLPSEAIGFATSIVLNGDGLFIGRTGVAQGFPMPPVHPGSVVEYRPAGDGGWKEVATISDSELTLGDRFATSLAASGNLLAVGAPLHGTGGAVFVFERRGGKWVRTAKLESPAGGKGDEFGLAVALDGSVLVVSAPSQDSARGAVYAFRRGARGTWSAPVTVGKGAEPHDRYGRSLSLGGGRLLVGSPGPVTGAASPQDPLQPKPGAAIVYRTDRDGGWTEEARLSFGADSAVGFGFGTALSGGEALVGAPGGAGAVYAFRRTGSGWQPAGKLVPAEPEANTLFGFTMARAGTAVLVGAQSAGHGSGRVYVFEPAAQGWRETQQLATEQVGISAGFGASLAAAADVAVIGSPYNDFFEGRAGVFRRDRASGEWKEHGTLVDTPPTLPPLTGRERKCDSGKIGAFPCERVDLLAFVPNAALGAKRGILLNDLWGWTDSQTGHEYALVGRVDGTAFVDVTDPTKPVYVGELPLHQGARINIWRDIKVYKDHAFIVADGAGDHGMQVFDLGRLRGVTSPPVTFTESAHYDGIASAHNIVINEDAGFAYAVGANGGGETCGGALHMIDIKDPDHPVFAGCFADPSTGLQHTGYTHDAECVTYKGPDSRFDGREICFNSSETAVGIADVTDKKAPRALAVATYPNVGYAHQGWLSEDQRYFFQDDELDELAGTVPKTRTLVWDVSNLEEPVLAKEFFGTTGATDHNLYIRGKYMFQSDYVAGLRVIDISDPTNPRETAYFDTVPFGDNVPGFAGSWSNYPFFKSGTIVVTSMREGLFVLRHNPQEPLIP